MKNNNLILPNKTELFCQEEFKKDLQRIIESIEEFDREINFYSTYANLLSLMFREYITSEWFAKADRSNKRAWFDDYEALVCLLTDLEEFIKKYTPKNEQDNITLIEVKAQYES